MVAVPPIAECINLTMAKSLRSKSKRAFRSKKREVGVYAATEAARLNRLNQKLVALKAADPEDFKDVLLEGDTEKEGWMDEDKIEAGWCWFPFFGLCDQDSITPESMQEWAGLARWEEV
ncbi:hypothetical protein NEOLEDRAFT_1240607 [Neolentinus lepideus HHB14362 ss-1]|uniref:DUF2423 domain-containing protein n=1 Tax=Neolentinus lepideus HHB14362 ss-1 TaxID=1314782 RepID=A0A165TNL5_9AGAM|nr:hypothetical protein NEOLEDRAFT_1240607 [Neolentinus lepideus HHB14362 ss-1]